MFLYTGRHKTLNIHVGRQTVNFLAYMHSSCHVRVYRHVDA